MLLTQKRGEENFILTNYTQTSAKILNSKNAEQSIKCLGFITSSMENTKIDCDFGKRQLE